MISVSDTHEKYPPFQWIFTLHGSHLATSSLCYSPLQNLKHLSLKKGLLFHNHQKYYKISVDESPPSKNEWSTSYSEAQPSLFITTDVSLQDTWSAHGKRKSLDSGKECNTNKILGTFEVSLAVKVSCIGRMGLMIHLRMDNATALV